MRRFLDALYLGSAILGAVCVVGIVVIMLVQVFFREVGYQVRGADDLTAWACAGAAFLPLALTFKRGELVRMGIIVDQLPWGIGRWVELLALAIAAVFASYVAWWLGFMVYESWVFNELARGLLPIPIWIPQTPVALGALVLAIALWDEFVRVAAGFVPTYVASVRERHARGDYSGEV